jgi:CheY-like chemotaxis protein
MKKARILYVDDEIGAARLLKLNLEATGRYEVNIQNWPEDALDTARTFKPDLLLLDLIMPRMPGGNVVSAFEQDHELKDVPIIFFTASVWRERVQEHDGIICNHPCLAKPARLEEIIAFIDINLPLAVRAGLPEFFPITADTNPATAIAPT